MAVYKVTFVNNEPTIWELTNYMGLKGSYVYEHSRHLLIYALINADTKKEAASIADIVIKEFKSKQR